MLRHELPLAAGDARALLADALAGGFSLAMAVAGAASLAAAAMLALAARGEAGCARPETTPPRLGEKPGLPARPAPDRAQRFQGPEFKTPILKHR